MKSTLSVLVSDLRGKAGNVVASSWKGQRYFRERVTPANPETVDQVAHRLVFSNTVSWWHDLEQQVIDDIDALAEGLCMSGFNAFCKRNIKDVHEADSPRIMPLNATVNPVSDDITLTPLITGFTVEWTQGESATGDKVYILTCEMTGSLFSANLVLQSKDSVLVQTETHTLSGLETGQKYGVFVLVEHVADHHFSVARFAADTCSA